MRVLWTERRSNQSILKEINPEYSLEGLMLQLKLQYFGRLMQTANSLAKTGVLGKIVGKRRRGWQSMRFGTITDSMEKSLSKLREIVKNREARGAAVRGVMNSWTQVTEQQHHHALQPFSILWLWPSVWFSGGGFSK